MTITAGGPGSAQASVDEGRWPDVARVPIGRIHATVAARLLRRAARRVDLRLALPDGTSLGSADPAAPIMRLHRPEALHRRLGRGGLIGFGEAYQAGDWDAGEHDETELPRVLSAFARQVENLVPRWMQRLRRAYVSRSPRTQRNTVHGSRRNIHRHYDLSNDLFALFLDKTMTYSSALFDTDSTGAPLASAESLSEAQHRKIDTLLDRVGVGPGMRLLEIGTGWGELAIRAARRGATVHSLTISAEQYELAVRRVAAAGLTDRVTVELRDYRELEAEPFHAIVSVEMIEAVGERYWRTYFATLDDAGMYGGLIFPRRAPDTPTMCVGPADSYRSRREVRDRSMPHNTINGRHAA